MPYLAHLDSDSKLISDERQAKFQLVVKLEPDWDITRLRSKVFSLGRILIKPKEKKNWVLNNIESKKIWVQKKFWFKNKFWVIKKIFVKNFC